MTPSDRDVFVSVVLAVRDRAVDVATCLPALASHLGAVYRDFEIIVVDDGSAAEEVAAVRDVVNGITHARLIVLSRAFGEDIAITAGLDSAIGDAVVTMLLDDPIELVPSLVQRARREARSLVGIAISPSSGLGLRARLARALLGVFARVAGVQVPAGARQFRVLSRQAVGALLESRDRQRSLAVLTSQIGFGSATFEYELRPDAAGRDGGGFWRDAGLVVDLSVATGRRPLRLVSAIGILGSAGNLLYAAYVVGLYLTGFKVIEGWTTLSLELSVMFFLLFLLLAVMAEYLGHLLAESRDRPLYFVADEFASPAPVLEPNRMNLVDDLVSERL